MRPPRERRALTFRQRQRLRAAAVDLVLEYGYEAVGCELLIARAGIPRAAFEAEYRSAEECVLGAVDAGVRELREAVFAAYRDHEAWREGLRAAAYAAARWVRDHPRYLLFATTVLNGASETARAHRDTVLRAFVEIIDAGRWELEDPASVSPGKAMAVIGSIYELLLRELSKGRGTARAEDFVPDLMYLAVRPYLGHAEALKELSIPAPEAVG